jgi:hypothetical protein
MGSVITGFYRAEAAARISRTSIEMTSRCRAGAAGVSADVSS